MRRHPDSERSPAEWITLTASLLLVGGLVAVALVEEARREEGDVSGIAVIFDSEHAVAQSGSYYVPYTVENIGSSAIASAEIWIEVLDGEAVVHSAEVAVQSLPLRGRQNGIFVSAYDPTNTTLRGRLESLQFP
jgi:uncharacterized protein (TIGR02588 family)